MSLGSAKISDSLCGLSTLILAKDRHIQGRALAVSAVTADVRIQIWPICCGMSVLSTYQNGNITVWACFGCGETHEYACGGESQARSKKWQGMQWLFACEQVDELISANRSKNAGDESDCG